MTVKFTISIFLVFVLACQNDDVPFDDTPVDSTSFVGEWLLKETFISPGGSSEWTEVTDGHRYIFNKNGSYKKTDFNKELLELGEYELKEGELYLYFLTEHKKDTLGFSAAFNGTRDMLTISPLYPVMCIEGCLYRFEKE